MSILRTLCVIASLTAAPAYSCDLALMMAVDVSGSVEDKEYRIQVEGLSTALRDPVISNALVRANAHLSLVQWTGSSRQEMTIPWRKVDTFEALDQFAAEVAQDTRRWRHYSTAIGEVLSFAVDEFAPVHHCARKLIDLSGDGESNEGVSPAGILTRLKAADITVNALAIEANEPNLTAYFFENVIVGEGAFVATANDFDDYPAKIRKKLLREVTLQSASIGR